MRFRIPYQIGTAHNEPGYLHLDAHTNAMGHSLITNTLGVKEVERRLRDVLGEISRDIEQGIKRGAVIE